MNQSDQLLVGHMNSVSLQTIITRKLDFIFLEQSESLKGAGGVFQMILSQVERPMIELALKQHAGNQLKAAKLLGINRNTLRSKMNQLGILIDRSR